MRAAYAALGVLLAALTFFFGIIFGLKLTPAPEPLTVDLSACQMVTQ